MDSRFFRQYANMVAEAEQFQQLDENIVNNLKAAAEDLFNKARAIPGFAQEYTQAKQMKSQLTDILKSAKSGQDAVDQVKQLAGVNEGWGAVGAGIGSAVYLIGDTAVKLLDQILSYGPVAALVGVPILIIVLAAFRSGR